MRTDPRTDPGEPIAVPVPEARPRRAGTILGRLSHAVREQNWFAVVLELLIVVLGVVAGFQITAWGDERAARAEERELLQGLRAEFGQVGSELEVQLEKHRRVEEAVVTVLAAVTQARDAGAPFGTVPDVTLAWVFVPSTTQFSQGILNGMLVTGRLELIRDRELRTALSEWEGVLADVTEDEVGSRQLVMDHLDPIFWSRMDVSPFRSYALDAGGAGGASRDLPSGEPGSTSEVPVDSEVIGVLTARLQWQQHLIREFSQPREEAQRILALIDRSLE